MPNFAIETKLSGSVAGIDEAGRGPWAGPVVAAAVIFPDKKVSDFLLKELDDSKKLSSKKRQILYPMIHEQGLVGIGLATVAEIDKFNILRATMLAMQRAVADISEQPQNLIIDGNQVFNTGIPAYPIIKGDSLSYSIAAASIVAKVRRDCLMQELSADFPVYQWHKNVGYGTAEHQKALDKYGVSPHHRRSFRPIRDFLKHLP